MNNTNNIKVQVSFIKKFYETNLLNDNSRFKWYAWKKLFSQIVSVIRKLEINQIKFSSYVRAAYLAIIVFTERLTIYFTLITFVLIIGK